MLQLWTRYRIWLETHCPEALETLQPGASEEQIAEVEAILGTRFPEDYRQSLLIHNGQSMEEIGLLGDFYLLPLEGIVQEWNAWKELMQNGEFNDVTPVAVGPVRSDSWWHPQWLPISSNGNGDIHALDMTPPEDGQSGQILIVWQEFPERDVVSTGYRAWFEHFVASLESGAYGIEIVDGYPSFNNYGFYDEE